MIEHSPRSFSILQLCLHKLKLDYVFGPVQKDRCPWKSKKNLVRLVLVKGKGNEVKQYEENEMKHKIKVRVVAK